MDELSSVPLEWDYVSQTLLPHLSFAMFHYIPYSENSEIQNEEHFNMLYEDSGNIIVLPSGSFSEGLRLPPSIRKNKHCRAKGLIASDYDFMLVDMRKTVGERGHSENHPKMEYYVYTEGMHPGYTLLEIVRPGGTPERFKTEISSVDKSFLDGAKQTSIHHGLKETSRHEISFQGPAVTFTVDNVSHIPSYTDVDYVHALFLPKWPQIANEWIHRQRVCNWPSQRTIQEIVDKGCHVVAKGHPASKTMTSEWRFSFSYAERALSRQLSRIQKQCYLLLKVLHRQAFKEPKGIVSYHLKTVLYWAAEEVPQDLWTEDSLAQMLFYLLDKLLFCLIKDSLPSYFIPSNNLLDVVPWHIIKLIIGKVSEVRSDPMKHLLLYNKEHKFVSGPLFAALCDVFRPILEHGQNTRNVSCTINEVILNVFIPVGADLISHQISDFKWFHEGFERDNDLEHELLPMNNAIIIALDVCRFADRIGVKGVHPALAFNQYLSSITDDYTVVKLCTRLLERFPDAPNKEELQKQIGERSFNVEFRRLCNLYVLKVG